MPLDTLGNGVLALGELDTLVVYTLGTELEGAGGSDAFIWEWWYAGELGHMTLIKWSALRLWQLWCWKFLPSGPQSRGWDQSCARVYHPDWRAVRIRS